MEKKNGSYKCEKQVRSKYEHMGLCMLERVTTLERYALGHEECLNLQNQNELELSGT